MQQLPSKLDYLTAIKRENNVPENSVSDTKKIIYIYIL